MANEQNLKPFTSEQSHEEAVKNGRKGGIESGKAKRRQKTLAEIGDMLGSLEIKSEKNKQILRDAGVADEDLINDTMGMWQLTMKAAKGDPNAMEKLAKIRKQLQTVNVNENHNYEMKPLVDLTKRKKNGDEK
ncbi:hypothetical protein IKG38_03640 [Candidatus Saccharibacteria bacterium]|nr:hypothetical protein [Candidatus Saccharibacteria bacterium]